MVASLLAGLVTGLSLIVAIGAQNAFVLRQGLIREHVGVVVAICVVSDLLLIGLGTAGVGALVQRHHAVLDAFRIVGAGYVLWFAFRSFRSARHPQALDIGSAAHGRGSVAGTTLALTYLNPHVYLDTVLMLGNIANQHGPSLRWWFAGGAGLGSALWFSGLGYAARLGGPSFTDPRTWRVLDLLIGVVMVGVAAFLLLQ